MLRGIKPIQFIIRKLILVLMFIQTSEFTRIFIELAHPQYIRIIPIRIYSRIYSTNLDTTCQRPS